MWQQSEAAAVDYTRHIAAAVIEIAPKRFVSTVAYNGQFPEPLVRFKEGRPAIVDIHNDTDTPEQLHWHGQMVSPDVDGAAEEGTPFIPAHGRRRMPLLRGRLDYVFISRTIAPARTCTPDNIAARLDRCTSRRSSKRKITAAKFS
jgi:hypothetical protein